MSHDPTEEEIVRALLAVSQAYNIETEELNMRDTLTVETLFEMGDSLRQSFIAAASLEERVMGLKSEEQMIGLRPEQRMVGLSQNEKRLLIEELQRSLEHG